MKKIILSITILLLICIGSNSAFYYCHLKKVDVYVEILKKKCANLDFILDYKERKTTGLLFWDITFDFKDVEIYTKKGLSVAYSRLPNVQVRSYIENTDQAVVNITTSSEIKGYINLPDEVAKALEISTNNKFLVSASDPIEVNIITDPWEGSFKELNFKQKAVSLSYNDLQKAHFENTVFELSHKDENKKRYKGSADKMMFDIQDVEVPNNISLDIDVVGFHDATTQRDSYDGYLHLINDKFRANCEGKVHEDENNHYMSDMKFKVHNLEDVIKNAKTITIAFKQKQNPKIDVSKIEDNFVEMEKAIIENSDKDGDDIVFTIKDTNEGTLFNGKPFTDVFKNVQFHN